MRSKRRRSKRRRVRVTAGSIMEDLLWKIGNYLLPILSHFLFLSLELQFLFLLECLSPFFLLLLILLHILLLLRIYFSMGDVVKCKLSTGKPKEGEGKKWPFFSLKMGNMKEIKDI